MGTTPIQTIYATVDEGGSDASVVLTTEFQNVGDAKVIGFADSILVSIDLEPDDTETLFLAFLLEGRPVMKLNAEGTGLEREIISYDVSEGNSFCFRIDSRSAHTIQVQAKGDIAGGYITSIGLSSDGSSSETPVNPIT